MGKSLAGCLQERADTPLADVQLSPAYDMVSTSVYAAYQHNSPGIEFMRQKTWTPGKNLQRFIAATFGIPPREQTQMVEAISDAVAAVGPQVREAMATAPGFVDIGKRMLMAWAEGRKLISPKTRIGRSPLLRKR